MRVAGQLPDREIRDRAISGDAPGQGPGPGEAARDIGISRNSTCRPRKWRENTEYRGSKF